MSFYHRIKKKTIRQIFKLIETDNKNNFNITEFFLITPSYTFCIQNHANEE